MLAKQDFKSPNFTPVAIEVEFVVLHYTACSLEETRNIFCSSESQVSAHLVISEQGDVYEVVNCLGQEVQRAWHAGESFFNKDGKDWRSFNDFSVGIELVNLNGNVFEYSDQQYQALAKVMAHLKKYHPALQDPSRIIGHEEIASKRGKVDPGWMFDWSRFYQESYPDIPSPGRLYLLPIALRYALRNFVDCIPLDKREDTQFWQSLSTTLEAATKLLGSK